MEDIIKLLTDPSFSEAISALSLALGLSLVGFSSSILVVAAVLKVVAKFTKWKWDDKFAEAVYQFARLITLARKK